MVSKQLTSSARKCALQINWRYMTEAGHKGANKQGIILYMYNNLSSFIYYSHLENIVIK